VPGRAPAEAGTGLFASVFGLLFVIGFLLLASEVLLSLHRASVVRAAAADAAHAAAEAAGVGARRCSVEVETAAAARAVELLGPTAQVEVGCVADEAVAVSVESPRPRLAGFLGPATIRRSVEVRFETSRGSG
jgi:hypothetical protein